MSCIRQKGIYANCVTFISAGGRAEQQLIFPPGHFMTALGTSIGMNKGNKVCFKVAAHTCTHTCTWLAAAPSNCESQRKDRKNCLHTSRFGENIKLWVCVRVRVHDCVCFSVLVIFCGMMRRGRNVWNVIGFLCFLKVCKERSEQISQD